MSDLHEVACSGCGKHHVLNAEQARKQRVLRCECGQFVRMDRALPDLRSDPAPAPAVEAPEATPEGDEEQTHMLASLAAVSAMSHKARATQASLSGHERPSQPPRSFSPAPFRPSSAPPPGDKPLWYVDLGGAETVEMTIEQLIIARRSGKLGEGALVWRAGMPRWRPVGELIPASSAGRPTPTPPPPAPPPPTPQVTTSGALLPPPPPPPIPAPVMSRRQSDPPPGALGSYERPLATLEFALEKPVLAAPREPSKVTPPPTPPSRERRSSEPPRALTPIPQRAQTPLPQRPPIPIPPRHATPVPQRIPTPVPQPAAWLSPTSVVAPLPTPPARSAVSTAPVTLPPASPDHLELFGERPRWRTISMALLLCVGASGSGAFLVRSLRVHHQPLSLAPNLAPALPAAALSTPSAPPATQMHAAAAAEPAPKVVDLSSLSVEHAAPRAQARPAAVAPPKASEPSDDSANAAQTDPAPSSAPKLKNSDLPAAAHANPYTNGTTDGSGAKKPTAPNSDE